MTTAPAVGSPAPALVWDRIDQNERRTRNVLTVFAIVLLVFTIALWPVAWYGVYYLSLGIARPFIRPGPSPDGRMWVLLAVTAFFTMCGCAYSLASSQYHRAARAMFRRAGAAPVGDREPELRRIVENLSVGAGLPVPSIHVIETRAPNAFTAGLEPDRAHVAVTRGLLELLHERELRGVIAHELSHIGHHDVSLGSVLAACVTVLRVPMRFVDQSIEVLVTNLGALGQDTDAVASREAFSLVLWAICLGLIVFGLNVAAHLFANLAATFLEFARDGESVRQLDRSLAIDVSMKAFVMTAAGAPAFLLWGGQVFGLLAGRSALRGRELLADADAFALTRDAEGLACALAKIDAVGLPTAGADEATAHLFVADPIRRNIRWWDAPVMVHPPIRERIAALQGLAAFPAESLHRARAAACQWAATHRESSAADGTAEENDVEHDR